MGRAKRPKPARLAEKLIVIRESLDLSQNGMIVRLGAAGDLTQAEVSSFERGVREPPLPVLLRYARIAGVCVDILIDDDANLPKKLPSKPKH
jgi:transcriptional regulator with XRE-family HTH domain